MEKEKIIYDKRKAIGENIRAMRTAHGWEQEQLKRWFDSIGGNIFHNLKYF